VKTAIAEVFGQYRVLDVLGHGAMGVVYRAHDPRLDRFVALKIVHPGRVAKDADKARARLVSEARALARVAHPNVLAVYDVGVQDGLVFVALELVDGVDLAQWLRAHARPWTDVVALFVEAASGLAAVHAVDLVHRDVKPANILVERADRGRTFGRVLVADFGIARTIANTSLVTPPAEIESVPSNRDDALTEAGRVVGTPAYMAPEQHLGLVVGPAADQYALCVALYEALYGQRPFVGDPQTMLRAKSKPRAEPPKSDVPRWLWTIVHRGLSPRPSDRFATMTDMIAALQAGAPPRKWLAPVGVTIVIAVVGSAIASSLARDRPCRGAPAHVAEVWNEARGREIEAAFEASTRTDAAKTWGRVAERVDAYANELSAAYGDACEATHVRHEQSSALFDRRIVCLDSRTQRLEQSLALLAVGDADIVDHAEDIASSWEPVDACHDAAALEAGIAPPSPHQRDAVANVRRTLADAEALRAAGRYDDAAAKAEAAVKLARAVDYAPVVVETLTVAAELRERQSRVDEAREALDEALSTGLQVGHDRFVARAVVLRTWIAGEYDHDIEAAEKWVALGRAHLERVGNPPHWVIALHDALGTARSTAGRYDGALQEFAQALERAEGDPELAEWTYTLHSNIGGVLRLLGQHDRARASYERALHAASMRRGDDHPDVANIEIRLGQLLQEGGRHHEAIAALRRAIASLERMQATPTELAVALLAFGAALRDIRSYEESNSAYRRAVDLLAETGDDVSLAHVLVNYGHSCVAQGIYDAAEAQFQRALELLEPIDPSDPAVGMALLGRGQIRERQSLPEEALSLYRQTYEASPPNTRMAAIAQSHISMIHHGVGRDAEAMAALDLHDAILAAAPLVLPDDRLVGATIRVRIMVDSGRAAQASDEIETLERLLDEARNRSGSTWLGRGDLELGRARLARGEADTACAVLGRAIDEIDDTDRKSLDQAQAALARCGRARRPAGSVPG
jgi:tetratricopeptide (TPR) repeat protein